MRDFYIQLKPSTPFWGIGKIFLSAENKKTKLLSVDSFSEEDIAIISASNRIGEIKVLDSEGKHVQSISAEIKSKEFPVKEEVQEDEVYSPEISCITAPIEEDEEEDEEEKELYEEEAKIVLEKNGNVIKKMIRNMSSKSEENVKLLKAILEVEMKDKNRSGIINSIKEKLDE
jgi:hypothetical protein